MASDTRKTWVYRVHSSNPRAVLIGHTSRIGERIEEHRQRVPLDKVVLFGPYDEATARGVEERLIRRSWWRQGLVNAVHRRGWLQRLVRR
jgi:hypothetical protein